MQLTSILNITVIACRREQNTFAYKINCKQHLTPGTEEQHIHPGYYNPSLMVSDGHWEETSLPTRRKLHRGIQNPPTNTGEKCLNLFCTSAHAAGAPTTATTTKKNIAEDVTVYFITTPGHRLNSYNTLTLCTANMLNLF